MSEDQLTINAATILLVREILIEERGADVTLEEATTAVKLALPFLTGREHRKGATP